MKRFARRLKIFLVAPMFALVLVGVFLPVVSSAATFTSQICQPASNGTGSITQCVNNIYIVAVAAAGFGGVILFAYAGYLYIVGTSDLIARAKKIMTSVIIGMLILFGTYAILNTINPNLTNLAVSIPIVTCTSASCPPPTQISTPTPTPTPPCAGSGCNLTGSDATSLAQQLLSMNGQSITVSSAGSCPGNSPLLNLQQQAAGSGNVVFDGPGSLCNQGKTNLDAGMLSALVNLAKANLKVTVTSLASGHHASTTDPHYAGRAVDFVPQNLNSDGQAIVSNLASGNVSELAVECNLSGVAQYIIIFPTGKSTVNSSTCTGQPNYHWHAQWSGVSLLLTPESD